VSEAGFVAKSLLIAGKDLRVEARGRQTLVPMLVFVLVVALLLAFTLPAPSGIGARVDLPLGASPTFADIVAGFLWITFLFAGLIGFARTFESERDDGALDALLLAPLDRSGLFLAKALANLCGLAVVEIVALPLFALLFGLELGARWLGLVVVVVLVDIGFVCVGTLFASLAAHTSSRELVLPILALPALVPAFVAGVELTADLVVGSGLDDVAARGWFAILVVFDVVTAAAGALLFEYAIE
jgi:heme exporter protein B